MKAIDRSETGDIPRDPVALRRLLAVRAPAAKTILASDPERSHQQAGHMDASHPIKNICQNTLQAGAVHIWIVSHSLAMTALALVLLVRIELTTSPLPMECSTTELQQLASAGRDRADRLSPETRAICHAPSGLASPGGRPSGDRVEWPGIAAPRC